VENNSGCNEKSWNKSVLLKNIEQSRLNYSENISSLSKNTKKTVAQIKIFGTNVQKALKNPDL
jgi:hypothetical protein